MGNQPGSKLIRQGETFAWIQDPNSGGFGMGAPEELPQQPPSSTPKSFQIPNTRENMLWNSLQSRLNPLTRNINKGMKCAFYMIIIAWLSFAFVSLFLRPLLDKDNETNKISYRFLQYGQMSVFVFVLLFFFLYGTILKKNARIDDEILMVINQELASRAQEVSYKLEYRTMYTGFCKPKGE